MKKTVLESVIDACRSAMHSHIPMIYLQTDDSEFVNELIQSNELVQLFYINPRGGKCHDFWHREELDWRNAVNYQEGGTDFSHSSDQKPFILNPSLFLIRNFHEMCDRMASGVIQCKIQSDLRTYVQNYINHGTKDFNLKHSVILLTSSKLMIPTGFEQYIEVVEVPYPEKWEIREIITNFVKEREEVPETEYMDELVSKLQGFSKSQIQYILRKIQTEAEFISNHKYTQNRSIEKQPRTIANQIILSQKIQLLKKSGILTLIQEEAGEDKVGGLEVLKGWLEECRYIVKYSELAKREWGIDFPKGVLISGIPGSGKSLMAKKAARILQIPLIKMDMGTLMGKHLGESEENLRHALRMAEAMSPCVLWIDELEKSFSGVAKGGGESAETSMRMFATFLNWMQDNKKPILIFATANDVSKLPPEFLRRGRFDQKFYAFMPQREECIAIFQACIERIRKQTQGEFNLFEESILGSDFLGKMVDYCTLNKKKLLTGADIEGIVKDTMKSIYIQSMRAKEQNGQTMYSMQFIKYTKLKFEAVMKEVIEKTLSYGETNLDDIADMYIHLQKQKFRSASGKELFPADVYDKEKGITKESPVKDVNSYDYHLYQLIAERINQRIEWNQNH